MNNLEPSLDIANNGILYWGKSCEEVYRHSPAKGNPVRPDTKNPYIVLFPRGIPQRILASDALFHTHNGYAGRRDDGLRGIFVGDRVLRRDDNTNNLQKHKRTVLYAKDLYCLSMLYAIRHDLHALANPEKAKVLARFFKTGIGQYGEGDRFLGITVPAQRKIAKTYRDLSIRDILTLIASEWHEERLTALLILVDRYERGDTEIRREVYDTYIRLATDTELSPPNGSFKGSINNWDLVDLSAPNIVGRQTLDTRDTSILGTLAISTNLWRRRIAIVATLAPIRAEVYAPTLDIARILLHDRHDLIHKATGWMLREVGKRDRDILCGFLDEYAAIMPRTMLRYAIERMPEEMRRGYMGR